MIGDNMNEQQTQILQGMLKMLDDPAEPETACMLAYRAVHMLLRPTVSDEGLSTLLSEMESCAGDCGTERLTDADY